MHPLLVGGANDSATAKSREYRRDGVLGEVALEEVARRAVELVLSTREVAAVPRLALRPVEAAAALGTSEDWFEDHVAGQLHWVRKGRLKLVAVSELEGWLVREARRSLEADR